MTEKTKSATTHSIQATSPVSLRHPQTAVLLFFGDYATGGSVSTQTVIAALRSAGVTEHATRATLSRMVQREILRKQTRGRRAYFELAGRGQRAVDDAKCRVWERGAVNHAWDGRWTIIAFSLPESWNRQRQALRSVLTWNGFRSIQGGVWVTPRAVDLSQILPERELAPHLSVFFGEPGDRADATALVGSIFEIDQLSDRYEQFSARWQYPPSGASALALRLCLTAEWIDLLSSDPFLPLEFLGDRWPGLHAEELFRSVHSVLRAAAEEEAGRLGAPTGRLA